MFSLRIFGPLLAITTLLVLPAEATTTYYTGASGETSFNSAVSGMTLLDPALTFSASDLASGGLYNASGTGIDFLGFDGGFPGWKSSGEPVDMVINVDAEEFVMDIPFEKRLRIVDVRREAEFADGHVAGALSIPLETLTDPGTMADFDDKDNIYIHCASGYRSMVAASLFKRQGIHNLHNVRGGWNEIKNLTGFNIEKEKSVLN